MAHALPAGTAAADDRLVAAGQGVVRNEPVFHHLGRSRAARTAHGPPHPAQRTVRTTNVGIHSRCGRRRDLRADGHALRDGHLPLGHLHLQYPGVMGSP